ncbi:MAG TPA: DUF4390 domain-containing protein [Advenella kashmirensis]|uniref:DUF4390 domain-containing protein n=2 Tax=Advenella TaxID=290425 RepID=A0A356LJR6_9BURK|nr:DUF4390 domain-containing protein [Advenella kashmirensis]
MMGFSIHCCANRAERPSRAVKSPATVGLGYYRGTASAGAANPNDLFRMKTQPVSMSIAFILRLALIVLLGLAANGGAALHAQTTTADADAGTGAAVATINSVEIQQQADGYVLNADVELPLSHQLQVAAQHGVPLYFTVEFRLVQPRWWWFDRQVYDQSQTWRVAYNALVRQWRVTSGDYSVPEMSLDDALQTITRIYNWPVGPFTDLDPDQHYEAQFRMKLDTSLLPRPFQMDALGGRAWALSTPWKNFAFQFSAIAPSP